MPKLEILDALVAKQRKQPSGDQVKKNQTFRESLQPDSYLNLPYKIKEKDNGSNSNDLKQTLRSLTNWHFLHYHNNQTIQNQNFNDFADAELITQLRLDNLNNDNYNNYFRPRLSNSNSNLQHPQQQHFLQSHEWRHFDRLAHLSCDSGEMILRLNFSEPFKGIVYPDHNRLSPCRFFGDGHHNYELRLPLRGCGTRQVSHKSIIITIIIVIVIRAVAATN